MKFASKRRRPHDRRADRRDHPALGNVRVRFAAVAAEAGPGKTVAVVGDGAVGLLAVLAAKQVGADRSSP